MTLAAEEFIRRFLLHVLPKGFMKIRYFGFLAHRNKKQCIPLLRKLINPKAKLPEKSNETAVEMMLRLTGIDVTCLSGMQERQDGKGQSVAKSVSQYIITTDSVLHDLAARNRPPWGLTGEVYSHAVLSEKKSQQCLDNYA